MRAAVLHSHGAVPEVGDFRDPEPEDGAELLELRAAALNPIDIRVAGGQFPLERYETPYVAGKEGVGAREDGSLVYFEYTRKPFGAYGERTLIEAGSGYDLPDGLEPELAVCLGVSGLAAWLGLEWRGRLAPGETVLMLGASGVVGQIGVQAAKLMGAGARGRRGARRGAARARALARCGRGRPAGDDADDLAGVLRAASGGDGFDVVLDPLWGEPATAAVSAMKPFGRMVSLGQAAGAEATLTSQAIRSTPVEILGYTNYTAGEDRKAAAYAELAGHAARGEIAVRIERIGLDDVPEAWERQGSSPHAKLVVVP